MKRDATPIFGKAAKELLSRNDGVVHFGTITTLAESPLRAGVLWAGTDDGNLQVSRDGGATWTNVAARVPGVPKGTYVSRVEASRTGEGAAYVAFDGHRSNDFGVYLFFTSDYGQTWKSVSVQPSRGRHAQRRARAPEERRRAVRGHRARPLGELGPRRLRGRRCAARTSRPCRSTTSWSTRARATSCSARTAAACGSSTTRRRSSRCRARGQELHLFPIPTATEWRLYDHKGDTGHKLFLAPNPPEGALVTYWLGAKPGEKDEVKITVTDASGALVREIKGPKPTRRDQPGELGPAPRAAREARGGGRARFGGPPRGPLVLPGSYTVKVAAAGKEATQTVVVEDDPRIAVSDADAASEWYEAQLEAGGSGRRRTRPTRR